MSGIGNTNYIVNIGTYQPPVVRGRISQALGEFVELQSLPDDPVGTFALTLTSLVVGSAIQVESQSGVQLYNGTADTSSKLINLQAYAGGSPLNDLRIKVRKGSASPYYQPWETLATAIVGSQSIYVSQIPDE